jgi:hypothetical protein
MSRDATRRPASFTYSIKLHAQEHAQAHNKQSAQPRKHSDSKTARHAGVPFAGTACQDAHSVVNAAVLFGHGMCKLACSSLVRPPPPPCRLAVQEVEQQVRHEPAQQAQLYKLASQHSIARQTFQCCTASTEESCKTLQRYEALCCCLLHIHTYTHT